MPYAKSSMTDANTELKERVRAFWQAHPCGTKFSDAEMGTREFFERVEAHRYAKEWHIPLAADFAGARGLRVLEIGCGLGTDGAQFAKAGADYTGVDLTDAAVQLARKRFELFDLAGTFRTADAEKLDSLHEHARKLREKTNGYLSAEEFLSQNTDGAGNPLARVYSRREARALFQDFTDVTLRPYFLNKRFFPVIGNVLPRSVEAQLASYWGWHLWIY